MKLRKLSAATAILASGAIVMTACTPGGDDNGDNGATGGDNGASGDVVVGEAGDFTTEGQLYTTEPTDGTKAEMPEGFETADDSIVASVGEVPFINVNNDHSAANSVNNSVVSSLMSSGFSYFGPDLSINPNEEFGTVEMVSEDPLTIEYTINEDAVWSDGTPITALDYQLVWAAQTYAGPTEPGEDDDADEFEPGAGFSPSGTTIANYIPDGYEAESHDSKTFTATFPDFYADWQLVGPQGGVNVAAHAVAEEAGMSTDELAEAIESGDMDALETVAEIWNTGMGYAGDWDESRMLSSGPYVISDWDWQGEEAGGSVTVETNPEWWGTPPGVSTLTIEFVNESTHVQALENYDLNVVVPQPDEDVATALRNLAEGGDFIIHEGDLATWEHIDFQYQQGPFAETPELAEAFALCLPRDEIVEQIIQPINPEAEVLNARERLSFQEGYDDYIAESYDGRYDDSDIDGAAEILEEHDAVGTTVEINHFGQPRRHAVVEIIDTYCGSEGAGFDIVDAGTPDFSAELLEGNWSGVALFAWAGSGQIVSGENIYASHGAQNATGFDSPEVDELWSTVASDVSDEEREEALIEIEQHLWDELHGIPLFVHPGLAASDATIANVRQTAAQTQITWNSEQWQRAEASAE